MRTTADGVDAEPTDTIRLRVEGNPKKPGSKSYRRFALYRDGMSVGNFFDSVKRRYGESEALKTKDDIQWDSERGFISIQRNGKPIKIFVPRYYRRPRE